MNTNDQNFTVSNRLDELAYGKDTIADLHKGKATFYMHSYLFNSVSLKEVFPNVTVNKQEPAEDDDDFDFDDELYAVSGEIKLVVNLRFGSMQAVYFQPDGSDYILVCYINGAEGTLKTFYCEEEVEDELDEIDPEDAEKARTEIHSLEEEKLLYTEDMDLDGKFFAKD